MQRSQIYDVCLARVDAHRFHSVLDGFDRTPLIGNRIKFRHVIGDYIIYGLILIEEEYLFLKLAGPKFTKPVTRSWI